jgi:hypothetical protein
MSAFSNLSNVGDVNTIKPADEIKIGHSYTIDGDVYLCFYIGSEKYSYPGYVAESDVSVVNEMEERDIPRFDFIRLGTSSDNPRFLSIKEQYLYKYTIKEYSPAEECRISGGKKSKGSRKSKGSKKSRSKGSRKSRRSK